MHFRRPQRSQVCISTVSNNGIKRVMLTGEGRTKPEYTYLNWEFQQGEEVREGMPYRVVILPDPRSTGSIMKRIIVAIVILLVTTAARADTARVCTKAGRCGTVVAWAASSFRGLIRDLESAGYAIGSPGCLSRGHMRNSKHHWGGACDLFNQVARNRTALRMPPARMQIAMAERHGLTSGCVWRHRDCAHFEVPRRTRIARAD